MSRGHRWMWLCAGWLLAVPALAQPSATASAPAAIEPIADTTATTTRSGREIYQRFREGLADPHCEAGSSSTRWRQHFATAPQRLASRNDDLLPLFGYVVAALREASLPTEYALIPFVESGYKPGARSPSGPAGLWQMITVTARNHHVPIRAGYDGRYSPVDSTKAAVRYLKTLHGMFAGDWRLAVMAYNAGEYRILGALKRGGQKARSAKPEQLPGLSEITHAYVRKLHALSCLMEQADDREDWLRALDRPVPRLAAITVPADVADIASWAKRNGQDAAQLQRLNPVFANGRIAKLGKERAPLLAIVSSSMGAVSTPVETSPAVSLAPAASASVPDPAPDSGPSDPVSTSSASPSEIVAARRHTVTRGDNAWSLARRYGIRVADLLQRNQLATGSVLKPGLVLQIDPVGPIIAPLPE
ncbi:MAG: transglycosylase SLT domain-containing protein [Lysobacter sp.]